MNETTVENALTVFTNEELNANVRVVEINGEPWFVAVDVCKALELSDTGRATERLDEDESTRIEIDHPQNPNKKIEVIVVNEPGLYSLILGSRKPEAKQFKRWVTHEVLPSIRKTGEYSMKPMTELEMLQVTINAMVQQEREVRALKVSDTQQNLRLTALENKVNNPFTKDKQKLHEHDVKLESHEERIDNLETVFNDPGPKEEIKTLISLAVSKYSLTYNDAYKRFYNLLSREYGINITSRLTALKKRKREQGMSESKISQLNKLDAITAAPELWDRIREAVETQRQAMNVDD